MNEKKLQGIVMADDAIDGMIIFVLYFTKDVKEYREKLSIE